MLGQWRRDRGFGLGPFGEKWWVAPLNKSKITPTSLDVEIPVDRDRIQVIEVIEVTPDGDALYRDYFVNPEGGLVKTHWVSQYEHVAVCANRTAVRHPEAHEDDEGRTCISHRAGHSVSELPHCPSY